MAGESNQKTQKYSQNIFEKFNERCLSNDFAPALIGQRKIGPNFCLKYEENVLCLMAN